jgi:hypothetical protein
MSKRSRSSDNSSHKKVVNNSIYKYFVENDFPKSAKRLKAETEVTSERSVALGDLFQRKQPKLKAITPESRVNEALQAAENWQPVRCIVLIGNKNNFKISKKK